MKEEAGILKELIQKVYLIFSNKVDRNRIFNELLFFQVTMLDQLVLLTLERSIKKFQMIK